MNWLWSMFEGPPMYHASPSGTGRIAPQMPEDTSYDQLRRLQWLHSGSATRGPEAEAVGTTFYRRRRMMNNWFTTPGMIEAGAHLYSYGPKMDL